MDEEDTSQFGIAPKGIRATSDYVDHGQRGTKRERINRESSGPIPGTPVLKELLKPVKYVIAWSNNKYLHVFQIINKHLIRYSGTQWVLCY